MCQSIISLFAQAAVLPPFVDVGKFAEEGTVLCRPVLPAGDCGTSTPTAAAEAGMPVRKTTVSEP